MNGAHTFPSNFMFVAAMNPCPCGYYPSSKCRCSDYEIIKYRGKISGPIMDRIDIQKEVKPVDFFGLKNEEPSMTSEQMTTDLIQKYCDLHEASLKLLKDTSEQYSYSARVIHKLLRLARTSADLDGHV